MGLQFERIGDLGTKIPDKKIPKSFFDVRFFENHSKSRPYNFTTGREAFFPKNHHFSVKYYSYVSIHFHMDFYYKLEADLFLLKKMLEKSFVIRKGFVLSICV